MSDALKKPFSMETEKLSAPGNPDRGEQLMSGGINIVPKNQ